MMGVQKTVTIRGQNLTKKSQNVTIWGNLVGSSTLRKSFYILENVFINASRF